GILIGVTSVAAALGSIAIGKVSVRFGYERALRFSLGGACLFYLPQGFCTSPWQLLILRFLSGFFIGGSMPTANALIALNVKKERQGSIYGLSSSISNAGAAAGPLLGAAMATLAGYRSVFFLTAMLFGMVAIAIRKAGLGTGGNPAYHIE
ncbi:MAG: MFS transporter, partial [Rectinema sp.]|nr:MFS transporter [Rectinema sp.]